MQQMKNDWKRGWPVAAALILILGMEQLIWHQICPMKLIFGLPCPGCGLTRAGLYVLTFRWREAWEMNAAVFLWAALILYGMVHRYIHPLSMRLFTGLLIVVCAATWGYYIYRMQTIFPDTEPLTVYSDSLFAVLFHR